MQWRQGCFLCLVHSNLTLCRDRTPLIPRNRKTRGKATKKQNIGCHNFNCTDMLLENLVRASRNIGQLAESISIEKLWIGSKNQITKQCSSEIIEDLPDVLKSLNKREQSVNNQPKPIQRKWFQGQEVETPRENGRITISNWLVNLGTTTKITHTALKWPKQKTPTYINIVGQLSSGVAV